jgi:hypothetical protein
MAAAPLPKPLSETDMTRLTTKIYRLCGELHANGTGQVQRNANATDLARVVCGRHCLSLLNASYMPTGAQFPTLADIQVNYEIERVRPWRYPSLLVRAHIRCIQRAQFPVCRRRGRPDSTR